MKSLRRLELVLFSIAEWEINIGNEGMPACIDLLLNPVYNLLFPATPGVTFSLYIFHQFAFPLPFIFVYQFKRRLLQQPSRESPYFPFPASFQSDPSPYQHPALESYLPAPDQICGKVLREHGRDLRMRDCHQVSVQCRITFYSLENRREWTVRKPFECNCVWWVGGIRVRMGQWLTEFQYTFSVLC